MKKLMMAVFIILIAFVLVSCDSIMGGTDSPEPSTASESPSATTDEVSASPDTSPSEEPSPSPSEAVSPSADLNIIKLKGKIGDAAIHMTIQITDGKITGTYYFDQNKKEIKLEGTIEDNRQIKLSEFGDDNQVSGTVNAWYMPGVSVKGTWTTLKDNTKQIFALSIVDGVPKGAAWAGEWKRFSLGMFRSASLVIFNETATGFDFQIDAYSGARSGFINGSATIDGSIAYFEDAEASGIYPRGASITFAKKDGVIDITANDAANARAGAGVEFDGKYKKGELPQETLFTLKYLPSQELDDAFRVMVGEDYNLFLSTADMHTAGYDFNNIGATVTMWWVHGFAGSNESIVMLMPDGKLCAAAIDTERNTIKVYTNADYITFVPKTIRTWAKTYTYFPFEFKNSNA